MFKPLKVFILFVFISHIILGQNKNIQLLGQKTYTNASLHGRLSDVWGYTDTAGNEYAIVGLEKGISIVDVTNPGTPVEVFYAGGASSIWRDIKTWNKHAYITNESNGGLMIIDMSNLPGTISSSDVYSHTGTNYPFFRAHNLYIDESGFAYIFGSSYGKKGAIFLDLNNNPKIPVEAGVFDTLYLHDGVVRNDTLWGAAVYAGYFVVVDVSNKANPVILKSHNTSGFFTHNCWISDDGNYLYTTDEISGGAVGAYDVSDLSNIDEVDLIWSNPGSGVIPHNTHVYGNYLVTSYYRDGVTVVDATQPDLLVEVGNYDTSPLMSGNGFNGSWGAYPYLPSGNLLASDIENGLFILGVNYQQGVYLQGNTRKFSDSSKIIQTRVLDVTTGDSVFSNLNGFYKEAYADTGWHRFEFSKAGYLPDTVDVYMTSGQMHYADVYLRNEVPFILGGRIMDAVLNTPIPAANVYFDGKNISYRKVTDSMGYFEIDTFFEGPYEITWGKWLYQTSCATKSVTAGDSILIFTSGEIYDDFTFDNGWTTSDQGIGGYWAIDKTDYGFAVNGLELPSTDDTTDCSDFAFVTGTYGNIDHDVDGGWNWLISPVMDVTHLHKPVMSFSYWFRNDATTGEDDSLIFYLADASDTVLLFKVHNQINLYQSVWLDTVLLISELGLDLSSLRFLVKTGDFGDDDQLEAAVDHFSIKNGFVGLEDINVTITDKLSVYPNPFNRDFEYVLPSDVKPTSYTLTDVTGRLVSSGLLNSVKGRITVGLSLQPGLLILEIKDEKGEIYLAKLLCTDSEVD